MSQTADANEPILLGPVPRKKKKVWVDPGWGIRRKPLIDKRKASHA